MVFAGVMPRYYGGQDESADTALSRLLVALAIQMQKKFEELSEGLRKDML